jgi:hypothetical protein
MKVDISTILPCQMDEVIKHVKTPRLHRYVTRPVLKFVPLNPPELPEVWTEGTYWVSMYLFGFIPSGRQAIVISFPESESAFTVRDAGHGSMVRQWDHVVTIQPKGEATLYRDRVSIKAGLLTPIVWAFARFFYQHRQRRWRRLAENSFQYGDD